MDRSNQRIRRVVNAIFVSGVFLHAGLSFAYGRMYRPIASVTGVIGKRESRPGNRIAILGALPPLTDEVDARAVSSAMTREGTETRILSPEQLADLTVFNASRFDVLVLPHADIFPAIADESLRMFLKSHGRLLCLGGPAFSHYVFAEGGAWKTREERLEALRGAPMAGLETQSAGRWSRATGDGASVSTVGDEKTKSGQALAFHFSHFATWDNFGPPAFAVSPFSPGSTIMTFAAHGDALPQAGGTRSNTPALVIEWKERDGSRWIGAAPLSAVWKRYALSPGDFHYWPDSTSKSRGGPGDVFHPENARELRIGLAQSHAPMAVGEHQFWIEDIGSASLPEGMPSVTPPVLESLSPSYKVFHKGAESDAEWLPVQRERGIGLAGERAGRWVPEAAEGAPIADWQAGTDPAWCYRSFSGPTRGAVWGGVAYSGKRIAAAARIAPLLRRMQQTVVLINAGAERVSYHAGERVVVGGKVINLGQVSVSVDLGVVCTRLTDGKSVLPPRRMHATIAAGATRTLTFPFVNAPPPGEYRVKTILIADTGRNDAPARGRDFIVAPFRVLPSSATVRSGGRVTVRGPEFVLAGKPWRPVGVNYWPLWVAGQDPRQYALNWLSPEQYDPELVERDLTLCAQLGMNLVSVQYTHPDEGPSVEDFLARCQAHGLKANIFLAGANPLDFHGDAVRALLRAAHLEHGNGTVFAWDLAWEPHMGAHEERKRLDAAWREWIALQYGTVENAESDWQMRAPKDQDLVTNPADEQLATDGPWRNFVAAYRRFLDDRISAGYRTVIEWMRPTGVLCGARTGYGGNGSAGVAGVAPFDLLSGACHLDFISPEGYALQGDWPAFRAGGVTTAYARWAGDGKPVFWAEFGQSITARPGEDPLTAQADLYDKTYRLIVESGANGSAAWWFPGGLRIDEDSDFGIVNPDGTPRPAAVRLRRHAANEIGQSAVTGPILDGLIIDRDRDARGYAGTYARLLRDFAMVRVGWPVGIMTEGSYAETANVALTAVGNVPATGHNPLKFVNAELEVHGKVLTLINTGDATWSAVGRGRVGIVGIVQDRVIPLGSLPGKVKRYKRVSVPLAALLPPLLPALRQLQGRQRVSLRLAVMERKNSAGETGNFPFGEALDVAEISRSVRGQQSGR